MTASVVKIGLREKEKVNRPSGLRKNNIGMLYKTQAGKSGVVRIVQLRHGRPTNWNFGIKSFYPKIGGHVFTPKFGRRTRELTDFQVCANPGIGCMRIDIS